MIHPTATVDPSAELAEDISVGPWCVIGPQVKIAGGCELAANVQVSGPTVIGKENRFYPFAMIGGDPQDKKYAVGQESRLELGDRNTIREFCTINRGTGPGGGITRIGNDNWVMAYTHIAHDCIVHDGTVFANNATLAGHVEVEDYAILGGFSGIHQFCRIGRHALTAISSVVTMDVPPYTLVAGNTARPRGINKIGLQRHGYDREIIAELQRAYRTLYRSGLMLKDAVSQLEEAASKCAELEVLLEFIKGSQRGIVR